MIKRLKQYIFGTRNIPDSYFCGYRRLADKASDVTSENCSTCKRAVAFVTWHCDLPGFKCRYARCYVKDELSKADLLAGLDHWIGLPDG